MTITEQRITDNLEQLLDILPPKIRESIKKQPELDNLIEVVLDLGREAEAGGRGGCACGRERSGSRWLRRQRFGRRVTGVRAGKG